MTSNASWTVEERPDGDVIMDGDTRVGVVQSGYGRRIVACVNACVAIGTEALEEAGFGSATVSSGGDAARY